MCNHYKIRYNVNKCVDVAFLISLKELCTTDIPLATLLSRPLFFRAVGITAPPVSHHLIAGNWLPAFTFRHPV